MKTKESAGPVDGFDHGSNAGKRVSVSRPNNVTSGMVMVQDGLLLPPELKVVTESYSPGWRMVLGSGGIAFDHRLRQSGWGCFFLAGELRSVSFGGSRVGMLDGAVRKLLAKVRSQDFNCAEFTVVTTSHFLGIPYVSVRGHARHVQQGCQLDSADNRKQQRPEISQIRPVNPR